MLFRSKDDSTPTSSGRCELSPVTDNDSITYSMCHLMSGWPEANIASAKTNCEGGSMGGAATWTALGSASEDCYISDRLGKCTWSTGSDTVVTSYYSSTTLNYSTAAQAEAHCGSSWEGTWSAG